jgi:GR25 family glycosyltransferase involved in LPS biosynthesis
LHKDTKSFGSFKYNDYFCLKFKNKRYGNNSKQYARTLGLVCGGTLGGDSHLWVGSYLRIKMNCHVINLDRRPERWIMVRDTLYDLGFKVTRFSAIDKKPGWCGCRDSHLALLESNRIEKYVLIFEDDIEFLVPKPISSIYKCLDELPVDWDALFLGASPQEPFERYSERLFKMGKAFCTHAIIWHNRKGGAVEYILDHKDEIGKIDVFFSEHIYSNYNCFLIAPLLITQYQSRSDCCKRSDLSTIVKNYEKFCI